MAQWEYFMCFITRSKSLGGGFGRLVCGKISRAKIIALGTMLIRANQLNPPNNAPLITILCIQLIDITRSGSLWDSLECVTHVLMATDGDYLFQVHIFVPLGVII